MVALKSDPQLLHSRKVLLLYGEKVRRSGTCSYPPLEAHLQEFYQKQRLPRLEIVSESDEPEKLEPVTTNDDQPESQESLTVGSKSPAADESNRTVTNEYRSENAQNIQTHNQKISATDGRKSSEPSTPPQPVSVKSTEAKAIEPPVKKQPPLTLRQSLHRQWQSLPAQSRYEQNLYCLFMQKAMINGDCSYPQLYSSVMDYHARAQQEQRRKRDQGIIMVILRKLDKILFP